MAAFGRSDLMARGIPKSSVALRRTIRPAAFGFALLAAGTALADGEAGTLNRSVGTVAPTTLATPGPTPPPDWRQETEASCGMSCRYHRANDNLTMQALYLVTKVQKIGDAIQKNDESPEARTALGAFCKDDAEALDDCFARYKNFQKIALLNLRQSIGQNEDAIAKLTLGRKNDGSVEDGAGLAFDTGAQTAPYLPEVPTLAELEQSYLRGGLKPAGSKYSRAEIQKWSQELVLNDPKAKYLQFSRKPAVGNPFQTEATAHSLNMLNRDGSGHTSGADARATAVYNQAVKSVKGFAADKTVADGQIEAVPVTTAKFKTDDKLSYEAYRQARSVVNSKIAEDSKRSDEDEKIRKLASEKGSKTKPSPTPSGVPSPTVGEHDGVSRDVRVMGSTARTPSTVPGYRDYGDDERVERSPEMKNSRYIKYDVDNILKDVESIK